ncbi:MAG: polymorphic toxin-type HINT domain-containing protein [Sulfuritalea sp.]|nr:polymorphic toxin-type HINT domain-containing protein [Sulfuritalea sp.]MDP1981417.1 polymorphic toxin-type HINT domain-containing protein [Sulfuritalea sp.]
MHGETLVYTRRQRELATPEIQQRFPNAAVLRTPVQIQCLAPGDEILTRCPNTKEMAYRRAIQIQRYSAELDQTYDIDFVLPNAKEGAVDGTHAYAPGDQCFWTIDRGWIPARSLAVGDRVLLMNGAEAVVERHRATPGRALLYNVIVEEFGTYFVTGLGIWVLGQLSPKNTLADVPARTELPVEAPDVPLETHRYEFLLPPHEAATRFMMAKNGVRTVVLPDGREGQPKNNLGKEEDGRIRGHPRFLDAQSGLVIDSYSPEPGATVENVVWMIAECKTRRHSSQLWLDLRRSGLRADAITAAIGNHPGGAPGLGRLTVIGGDDEQAAPEPAEGTRSQFQPCAETFVRWVEEKKGIRLRYDDDGVRWLDNFLLQYRPLGEINENLLVDAGSYFGECMFHKFGGQWEEHPDNGWMFKLCSIMAMYPFGMVRRHVENKYGDSLFGIYSGYQDMLEKKILDFLSEGPSQIQVTHTPSKVSPVRGAEGLDRGHYWWEYETKVASQCTATLLEFGAFRWLEGRWRLKNPGGKLFRREHFAQWYSCELGILEAGRGYKFSTNCSMSSALCSGRTRWFYLASDAQGKIIKGDAIVEELDQ